MHHSLLCLHLQRQVPSEHAVSYHSSTASKFRIQHVRMIASLSSVTTPMWTQVRSNMAWVNKNFMHPDRWQQMLSPKRANGAVCFVEIYVLNDKLSPHVQTVYPILNRSLVFCPCCQSSDRNVHIRILWPSMITLRNFSQCYVMSLRNTLRRCSDNNTNTHARDATLHESTLVMHRSVCEWHTC